MATEDRRYSASLQWSEEDGGYVAVSPEFPGLSGVGESAEEALAVLREAIEMAAEVYAEEGRALPAPRTLDAYSGQFRLRVPKSVHAALAARAELEGVSLNTLALAYIARGLGQSEQSAPAERPGRRRAVG